MCIRDRPYIVKYAKNSPQGLTCSYLSEYIGSHLFRIAGIEAQETFLGKCDGLPVVVMKDFIGGDEIFVPFNDVGDSTLEQSRERYKYTYDCLLYTSHTAELIDWGITLHTEQRSIPENINYIGYRAHDFVPVWGGCGKNQIPFRLESKAAPVSYTHLDVYKRQVL